MYSEIAISKRRESRAKRVNAMQQWKAGVIDDRPVKERWSREYKDARRKSVRPLTEDQALARQVEGRVVAVHRRSCEVRLEGGKEAKAFYRAKSIVELREFPAVGDFVLLGAESEAAESPFYVVQILPRKSALVRPGPPDSHHTELTQAANIDQVAVVMSLQDPPFNYGFADRFLLAAGTSRLPFLLVLNKVDLEASLDIALPPAVREFMELADDFVLVSGKTGEGLEELRAKLTGKDSVLSGQSGVGKSTLVNALIPGAGLQTGAVREKDGKGRHTTTSSSLFALPGGGSVIDTPGIRALGLIDFEARSLAKCFPGFFPDDVFTCKFKDCLHQQEPGCAVLAGLESGAVSAGRYHSYLRILDSL
jgi:ribosome biogenesis GTPase